MPSFGRRPHLQMLPQPPTSPTREEWEQQVIEVLAQELRDLKGVDAFSLLVKALENFIPAITHVQCVVVAHACSCDHAACWVVLTRSQHAGCFCSLVPTVNRQPRRLTRPALMALPVNPSQRVLQVYVIDLVLLPMGTASRMPLPVMKSRIHGTTHACSKSAETAA